MGYPVLVRVFWVIIVMRIMIVLEFMMLMNLECRILPFTFLLQLKTLMSGMFFC